MPYGYGYHVLKTVTIVNGKEGIQFEWNYSPRCMMMNVHGGKVSKQLTAQTTSYVSFYFNLL